MNQGTSEVTGGKVCTRCGEAKPPAAFYSRKGGLRTACKQCTNEQNRSIYAQNKPAHLEAKRRYRENFSEARQATVRKYDAAHVEARRAHWAVNHAIDAGTLLPARARTCERCGQGAEVYHHASYDPAHWLDVVPLCRVCHGEAHRADGSDK